MPLWLIVTLAAGVGYWAWKSGHLPALQGLPAAPGLPAGPAKATIYTLTPLQTGTTINMHVGDMIMLQLPDDQTGVLQWSNPAMPPPSIFGAPTTGQTTDAKGNQITQVTLTAVGKGTYQFSATMQDPVGNPVGGTIQFTFVVS